MEKVHKFTLDLTRGINDTSIEVVTGDYAAHKFEITLVEDGYKPFNLEGTIVRLIVLKPDGHTIQQDCTIVDNNGKVSVLLMLDTINVPGTCKAEIQIWDNEVANKRLTSAQFYFRVRKSLQDDETVESTDQFSMLQSALEQAQNIDEKIQNKADLDETGKVPLSQLPEGIGDTELRQEVEEARGGHASLNDRLGTNENNLTTHLADYASLNNRVDAIKLNEFYITGHRGMMVNAPENTLSSFQYCYEYGVDGFECDVYQISTGEFVIIHDSTVDRTTDGTGSVVTKTLSEIKSLDAGSWLHSDYIGEKIPTLDEMLDYAKNKFKIIYLEIKSITSLQALYNLVKSKDMLDIVSFHGFLSGFNHSELRAIDKNVKISVITSGSDFDDAFAKAKEVDAFEIAIDWNWLKNNKDKIKDIHDEGIRVYCWNANDHESMIEAVKAGVNGLNLDNPLMWIKGEV